MVSHAYIFCDIGLCDLLKQVESRKGGGKGPDEDSHVYEDMSVGGPISLWIGLVAIAAII